MQAADSEIARSVNHKWPLWALLLFSVVGIVVAVYAAYQTMFLRWIGLTDPSGCSINAWINCDAVLASSHAFLAGVPVAWWGAFFYLWLVLVSLWALVKKRRSETALVIGFISSVFGVLFSCYKAYTLFFVLKLFCPVCVTMYLINLAIMLLFVKALGLEFRKLPDFMRKTIAGHWPTAPPSKFRTGIVVSLILVISLYASGFILAGYIESNFLKLPDVDIEAEVRKHFEQAPENIRTHESAPVWGNPLAKVEIVEFSDFQCSHCRRAAFHLRGLLWEFRDQVRFVFMNFPLDPKINRFVRSNVHQHAGLAARAAVCAQQRGKFWEYHDDLFKNQKNFSRDLMLDLAQEYGWDRQAFNRCLDANSTLARVRMEIEYAGPQIRSTPSLFINSRRVIQWRNPEVIQAIIREEIRRRSEASR